jgi:hypothetical protein
MTRQAMVPELLEGLWYLKGLGHYVPPVKHQIDNGAQTRLSLLIALNASKATRKETAVQCAGR